MINLRLAHPPASKPPPLITPRVASGGLAIPTNQRTAEQAERRAQVVGLRRQRLSMAEIGKRMGISRQRAQQLYAQALAEIPAAQVEEHRAEELMLIDDAISDLLDLARDHDRPRTAVEAWNSIRGWAERKARLLGLDAPERHEYISLDAIDREIAKLNAQMGLPLARENVSTS
jgi:hypothetical protein